MLNTDENVTPNMSVELLSKSDNARRYMGDDELSSAVALAVADTLGLDAQTTPPLAEHIEPDAIDALSESKGFAELTFEYMGCRVKAASDMKIVVIPEDPAGS